MNIQCEIRVSNASVSECSGQETDMFEFNTYGLFELGEILKNVSLKLSLKHKVL